MNKLLRINNNIVPLGEISHLSYNYDIKLLDDSVLSVIGVTNQKHYMMALYMVIHMKNGENIKLNVDKFTLSFPNYSEADEYISKVAEKALKEFTHCIFGTLEISKINFSLKDNGGV